MKLIHTIENIDERYGGPAKSVPSLVDALQRMGVVDSTICSVKLYDNESNEFCEKSNIRCIKSDLTKFERVFYSSGFKNNITNQIDNETIIHTHNLWTYPAYISYKTAILNSIPYVMSIRGNLYPWNLDSGWFQKKVAMKFFQYQMLKKASCLHATEINEVKAIRDLGISTPVALIPNGIDTREFDAKSLTKNQSKIELGLDENRRYLLFLSRIDKKKGLDILVHSFERLASKYPDWDLLIAGPIQDDNYFCKIEEFIATRKLSLRIKYLGMCKGNRKMNAYFSSDIFVLPTHSENFGMVIGEALASKTPVITTTGTPWKSLDKIKAGWCVELSEENIYKALDHAMSNSCDTLANMGANGYHYVKANYSWEKVAQQMKDVYEWVLGKAEKPKCIY